MKHMAPAGALLRQPSMTLVRASDPEKADMDNFL